MCNTGSIGDFVNLHVHTQYSLLDGHASTDRIFQHVSSMGQSSVGITDHAVVSGFFDFENGARASGIKPVYGMEGYIVKRGRRLTDKDKVKDRYPYHILLFAMNEVGLANLRNLTSISNVSGYYYRPRMDWELLEQYSEGLIISSGCIASELPQYIVNERDRATNLPKYGSDETAWNLALENLRWYIDVFGDRFYLEVQPRYSSPAQDKLNAGIVRLSQYAKDIWGIDIPIIATTDAHYVAKEDAVVHDALLCIQTGARVSDTDRMRFDENSYYLMSGAEVASFFPDNPEFLTNTVALADRIGDIQLKTSGYKLPKFPLPDGYTESSMLREMVELGLNWRYGDNKELHRDRVEYELSVIEQMGFPSYFLVVWDICEYAYQKGIPFNTRGSAAGSIVAYAMGITSICPMENELLFERFLNPDRVSMPDIDLDFPDDFRAELIEYTKHRYGSDRVAGISTYSILHARSALKDTCRVMDIPIGIANEAVSVIPKVKAPPLETFRSVMSELFDKYQGLENAFNVAVNIEGSPRHVSMHPAGIVITDEPVISYSPLYRTTGKNAEIIDAVTQYPMDVVESMGLLKVDFLGLKTLTIIRRALSLIEKRYGVKWELESIPYRHTGDKENDEFVEKALDVIRAGDTVGVFQLEGESMTGMFKEMQPQRYDDVVAGIALYRPGPMGFIPDYIKRLHGEKIEYLHPALEPILKSTYGVIVYQEQVMRIAVDLFGYSGADADFLRKAVAKKKEKDMEKHRQKFFENRHICNLSEGDVQSIWDAVEFFGNYGFNKGHAGSYGRMTMITALLYALYPHEYLASVLEVHTGDFDKQELVIIACKGKGIEIKPPDVRYSDVGYSIVGDDIICGLGMVKGVGVVPARIFVKSKQEYRDIVHMAETVPLHKVNKKALESLVYAGAFDWTGYSRPIIEALMPSLREHSKQVFHAPSGNQLTLFSMSDVDTPECDVVSAIQELNIVGDMNPIDKMEREKDLLGFYIGERPTDKFIRHMEYYPTADIARITHPDVSPSDNEMVGQSVFIAGQITSLEIKTTKNGNIMVFVQVTDYRQSAGKLRVVIFPKVYKQLQSRLDENSIVIAFGRLECEYGRYSLIPDDFYIVYSPKDRVDSAPDETAESENENEPIETYYETNLM